MGIELKVTRTIELKGVENKIVFTEAPDHASMVITLFINSSAPKTYTEECTSLDNLLNPLYCTLVEDLARIKRESKARAKKKRRKKCN